MNLRRKAVDDDATIRVKLAEKFRTGRLRRELPDALHPSELPDFPPMRIDGGRGKICSVCDQRIGPAEDGSLELVYPNGDCMRFHERCFELWKEDRLKPAPR
jgi:hypothetical protein